MSSLHSPSTTRRSAPSRRGRAGLAATAVFAAALPFAAACGAGFNAASQDVKPNAAAGSLGNLKVNNVWVIVDPNSGAAEVIGAVTNTGDSADQLVSVSADGTFATVRTAATTPAVTSGVTVSGNTVTVPATQSVSFGETGSPELAIVGGAFTPGVFSTVKLTFAQAGTLTLSAQVETDTGLFVGYNPGAGDTASATPSASASASSSAGASSGASASASSSSSASASSSSSASASPSGSK